MKKFILFIFLFIACVSPVKAELTNEQATDLAFFAETFISEGNKRISNEFPIFAYMQGQARIDGFQGELYKINKDYKSINVVNDYKWTFDDASFVSYLYYHVLNLTLTRGYTTKTDSYNGLKIMSSIAEPYYVNDFVNNARDNKHFYYVQQDVKVVNIDYDMLKKGDLIITDQSHIMIYVGDGKIAHAASEAITDKNLGMEVIKLSDKYNDAVISVIRLKNQIIKEDIQANLTVTWPDDNLTVNLNNLRVINDIPQITYTLSTSEWTKQLTLNVSINDADGIVNYVFNDSETSLLNKKSYQFETEITANGTYSVKVTDSLKNVAIKEILVTNIDNTKPKILTYDVLNKEKYSLITIVGEDLESGLATDAYSFKNDNSWEKKNTFEVFEEGTYKIYIKDKADNIFEGEIIINFDDKTAPVINNIIYGDNTINGQKIIITASDVGGSGIVGFLIKDSNSEPTKNDVWVITSSVNFTTFLKEGKHYVWVKDGSGNISIAKELNVKSFAETQNMRALIFIIPILILIVGIIFIRKFQNNKI